MGKPLNVECVCSDQGQVLKVLSGGDFFGEIGILSLSEGQNRYEKLQDKNGLILQKHWPR